MTEYSKSTTLYRGIVLNYPLPPDFKFSKVPIKPPYPPKIDQNGRKTVADGNEYGVYMSDYKEVAVIYGTPKLESGTIIDKELFYSNTPVNYLTIPAIGIIYEINTKNLDVHKPWITRYLKGHYNNGFAGNEWVTEQIPKENYKVISVEIGPDSLHESEKVDLSDLTKVPEIITKKIESRKKRIYEFKKYLQSLTRQKRICLSSSDIEILKRIYQEKGLASINIQELTINSAADCITFLMTKHYQKNAPDNIDFKTLKYINDINFSLEKNSKISSVIDLIEKNIIERIIIKEQKRSHGKTNKEKYSTGFYDNTIKIFQELERELIYKLAREVQIYQSYYDKILSAITRISSSTKESNQEEQEYLEKLNKQKLALSNIIKEREELINNYHQKKFNKEQSTQTILNEVEKILNIGISPIYGYLNNLMLPKTKETLLNEQRKINDRLEELYQNKSLSLQDYLTIKEKINLEYQNMLEKDHQNTHKSGKKY